MARELRFDSRSGSYAKLVVGANRNAKTFGGFRFELQLCWNDFTAMNGRCH